MKSYITPTIILLFCFFYGIDSKAQEFGVKAGPNFHTVTGDNIDSKMRVGFHLGGFAQMEMIDDFFFRPELLYSLEGGRSEMSLFGRTVESTVNYNYLALPMMFRYSLDGPYFEGGPSIGILMGGSVVSDGESEDLEMDNYNAFELAFEFGGGYALESGLGFGLRLDLGLTGVQDIPEDASARSNNHSNFGIRLSGAYSF